MSTDNDKGQFDWQMYLEQAESNLLNRSLYMFEYIRLLNRPLTDHELKIIETLSLEIANVQQHGKIHSMSNCINPIIQCVDCGDDLNPRLQNPRCPHCNEKYLALGEEQQANANREAAARLHTKALSLTLPSSEVLDEARHLHQKNEQQLKQYKQKIEHLKASVDRLKRPEICECPPSCGKPAIAQCGNCGHLMCSDHSSHRNTTRLCMACWWFEEAREDK
jgi:hypothetical protein